MPLPRIVLLPPELCNQIAAGEVVERPASVVKELVENSLDALSTFIEVRLENGGQGLIRVQDNGTGMAREDLELALTRHATSKIRTVEDLENINSYGFRGEALPSVASVSRCTLTSVPQGSDEAWTCRVTFGRLEGMEPSSLHRGTIVEVRDLFANVPARLKFLRGIPTEVKHCQDWLSRLALTRADVTFRLESEGRELVHFKAGQDVFDRLQSMWPKLVTENLVSLDRVAYGMRVHGFVSRPGVSQPKSNRILIFVNGRSVSDKKIFAAIREAYKGKITSRDHPQAVLFLELDPHEVDVNVHPAKSEVRFRDEKSVFRAILAAVGQTLERAGSANTPVTETIFQDSEDAGPGQEVQKAPFSADSGIHHHRYPGLLDDDAQEVTRLESFIRAYGGSQRHHGCRARFLQLAAEDGVGLAVGEDDEPHLHQPFRCLKGLYRVREQIAGVRVYFQLQPVRAKGFARHLGGKDSLLGIAHAGGIGQELDVRVLDVFQHIVVLVVQFNALHCHRHHFRARGKYSLFHDFIGVEFAGSQE